MSKPRTIYGWERDGRAYLSPFAASYEKRPANQYTSRAEAEAFAKTRNCVIVWE